MLQALNQQKELCHLYHLSTAEIIQLKEREVFFCPQCYKKVFIRFSKRMLPHFVHYSDTNCIQAGESSYHQQAKWQLYNWLKSQYDDVQLEKHVKEINQFPDVYVKVGHRQIACEFQSAKISRHIIQQRNEGYKQQQMKPIWFVGSNHLKQGKHHYLHLNSFLKQFIYQFDSTYPPTIFFYCPNTRKFTIWNDIYSTGPIAYGKKSELPLQTSRFPALFSQTQKHFSGKELFTYWHKEKQRFRLQHRKQTFGAAREWRNWLYEKGYFIDYLPSIIHLPVRSQYRTSIPLAHWQSRFMIDYFHPLPINAIFDLHDVIKRYGPKLHSLACMTEQSIFTHPLAQYIAYLVHFKYVKQVTHKTFIKLNEITFHHHIETAISSDAIIIKKLKKEQNIPMLSENSLY